MSTVVNLNLCSHRCFIASFNILVDAGTNDFLNLMYFHFGSLYLLPEGRSTNSPYKTWLTSLTICLACFNVACSVLVSSCSFSHTVFWALVDRLYKLYNTPQYLLEPPCFVERIVPQSISSGVIKGEMTNVPFYKRVVSVREKEKERGMCGILKKKEKNILYLCVL